ncbi:ribosomal protein S10 domain-containing protein [Lipomyces japonicus]|uniref:40S ribosomal protein uS10 n=1 Tax=Lipomyces japonicus TaxID=56871 RepID=UPI0034CEF747
MASYEKEKAAGLEEPKLQKFRITMTSRKVQQLEKVSNEVVGQAKRAKLQVKGPVRLPTKNLRISTRKTPNGEGSKTWDAYELRIHKRVIDLVAPSSEVKQITSFNIESGVDVAITVAA